MSHVLNPTKSRWDDLLMPLGRLLCGVRFKGIWYTIFRCKSKVGSFSLSIINLIIYFFDASSKLRQFKDFVRGKAP